MELRSQLGSSGAAESLELRRHPRFKVDVDIRVYPRKAPVVPGHTVDISESGISAMLREEVPLGGVVRLVFTLPLGAEEVLAMVRHRSTFRYGFQFVEASSATDIMERTCHQLAMAQREKRSSVLGRQALGVEIFCLTPNI